MSYRVNAGGGMFGDIPPVVRQLLLINTIILLAMSLLDRSTYNSVVSLFGLTPLRVVTQGMVCEPDGCKGACAPPEVTTSVFRTGTLSLNRWLTDSRACWCSACRSPRW